MLIGEIHHATPDHPNLNSVIVVGAGLAGATTAHALAERGCNVTVLNADGIGTPPEIWPEWSTALPGAHLTRKTASTSKVTATPYAG